MPVTQRRVAELQVRSVDREGRKIDFVASTFAIDSYGTRIDPAGWTFARNIPITWAHDDRGFTPSGGRPIGRAVSLRVENGELRGTAEFPRRGIFQFADECFDLAADGFITSTSVGFDPIKEEISEEDGKRVPIYRRQKCLEIAFVTIPSNEDAVLLRSKELNREEDVKTVQERIRKVEEMAKELQTLAGEHSDEDVEKWRTYFEKKQPANREATKVLERFFKLKGEKQPDEEVGAWKRMADLIEEPKPEPKQEEVKVEEPKVETPLETKEEPPPPPAPAPEAPKPERKASVQVSLDVFLALPGRLTKAYVDSAVEALRQGLPIKDAVELIDGMAVATSIPTKSHGNS